MIIQSQPRAFVQHLCEAPCRGASLCLRHSHFPASPRHSHFPASLPWHFTPSQESSPGPPTFGQPRGCGGGAGGPLLVPPQMLFKVQDWTYSPSSHLGFQRLLREEPLPAVRAYRGEISRLCSPFRMQRGHLKVFLRKAIYSQ